MGAPEDAAPPGGVRAAPGRPEGVHDLGGHGRPLVALHAAGFCAATLEPLVREMDPVFAGWGLDLRGHGHRNPWPTGGPARSDAADGFAWPAQAQDVLDVVDALGLEAPTGFGHSAGGTILLDSEARRPGTFGALYCYEPPLWPGAPPPGLTEALAAGARRRRPVFATPQEAYDHLRARPALQAVRADVLWAYVNHGLGTGADGTVSLRCTPEAEAATYQAGAAHDGFGRLGRVACPVTILVGELSPPTVHALADIQAAAVRSGRVVTLPGIGHLGPLEDPALVARAVAAPAPH